MLNNGDVDDNNHNNVNNKNNIINCQQQQTWIEKCRKELIDIEEKNLRTRAL